MCGIRFHLQAGPCEAWRLGSSGAEWQDLAKRGPDAQVARQWSCGPDGALQALLAASVLRMRPGPVIFQPVEFWSDVLAEPGFLCWNGEVYGGMDADGACDTPVVASWLRRAASLEEWVAMLAAVRGPHAFVVWLPRSGRLWFGRDPVGRRSLLVACQSAFVVSSTAFGGEAAGLWREVPIGGAFELRIGRRCPAADRPPHLSQDLWAHVSELCGPHTVGEVDCTVGFCAWPPQRQLALRLGDTIADSQAAAALPAAASALLDALQEAVRARVSPSTLPPPLSAALPRGRAAPARVSLLFSGGVDSSVLAVLLHQVLPPREPVDLVNVCFDVHGRSPDRVTALAVARELARDHPSRPWRLVCVDARYADVMAGAGPCLGRLVAPKGTVMDHNIGIALWCAASGRGRLADLTCTSSRADRAALRDADAARASRRQGPAEPLERCPAPSREDAGLGPSVRTRARVVMVGIGADELLGGYGSHAAAFEHGGWPSLRGAVEQSVARLWQRNLGRDDRCIADHGREARFPFLDEGVLRAVGAMPANVVCDPRMGRGRGEKRVLRAAAAMLGLKTPVALSKRALQFGSRVAKGHALASATPMRRVRGAQDFG